MVIILLFICIFGPFLSVMLFHLKNNCFLISFKADTISIPGCHTSFKRLVNNLSSAVYFMIIGQILME